MQKTKKGIYVQVKTSNYSSNVCKVPRIRDRLPNQVFKLRSLFYGV